MIRGVLIALLMAAAPAWANECDRLAAPPGAVADEPQGAVMEPIAASNALAACRAAVIDHPDEPRFLHQLGRAHEQLGEIGAAEFLYRMAMERGYLPGQVELAVLLHATGDRPRALALLNDAMARGSAAAMNELGVIARDGEPRNDREALRLFRLAAEQGHAEAMVNLAQMALNGRGMARDDREAARLLQRGAGLFHAAAQRELGLLHAQGRGVTRNDQQASRYFFLAAEQGDPDSQYLLARHYEEGRGLSRSRADAILWYRRAAENGVTEARDALRRLGAN